MVIQKNKFVEFKFDKFILYITILKNTIPTEEEFIYTLTTMNSFYEAAKIGNYKFSIIFDIQNLAILPKKFYDKWAEYFKSNRMNTKLCINKTAIICNSSIVKSTLNIFFKIYKTEKPLLIVSSNEEAINFISSN